MTVAVVKRAGLYLVCWNIVLFEGLIIMGKGLGKHSSVSKYYYTWRRVDDTCFKSTCGSMYV